MDKPYTNNQKAIIIAYNKGYRIVNNRAISPKGRILKVKITNGYYNFSVAFNISCTRKSNQVCYHRLVAYQKYGEKMFDHDLVRHLNGNPLDNSPENIALGSYSDNMFDIPEHIRIKKSLTAASKLRRFTDETLENILNDRKNGASYNVLIKKYGGSKSLYSFIFNKSFKCKNDKDIQRIQKSEKLETKTDKHIKLFVENGGKIENEKFTISNKTFNVRYSTEYPSISYKKVILSTHRIVAYMKYGEMVFSKNIVVRHLNNNKFDFSWDNIAIGSQSENILDIPVEKRRSSAKNAAQYMLRSLPERLENNQIELAVQDYSI